MGTSDKKTPFEIQKQAIVDRLAKAPDNYIYCSEITFEGKSVIDTASQKVAVRWLWEREYLYCDNTPEAITEITTKYRHIYPAGYIVYVGDTPKFIVDQMAAQKSDGNSTPAS